MPKVRNTWPRGIVQMAAPNCLRVEPTIIGLHFIGLHTIGLHIIYKNKGGSTMANRRQLAGEEDIAMTQEAEIVESERWELLRELEEWLEAPMVALGFIWLALLVVELVWGVGPFLQTLGNFIWGLFIVDFAVKLLLAPAKLLFLRRNWLTMISLVLPATRVLRVVPAFRALSTLRGLRFVRVLTSLNRGMRSLRASMGRRGLGYVIALTGVVTLTGAAGMFAFENNSGSGIDSFGVALWWTGMLMTTLGSEAWPRTPEGRMLGFLLAFYAVVVVGYITASLASYFIGRDAQALASGEAASEPPSLQSEMAALHTEVRALRRELELLRTSESSIR